VSEALELKGLLKLRRICPIHFNRYELMRQCRQVWESPLSAAAEEKPKQYAVSWGTWGEGKKERERESKCVPVCIWFWSLQS